MTYDFYPVNDFGPVMKGMAIGGLGILHVFLAQFAIGGGFVMCYLQWLLMTGRSQAARLFLDSFFKFLVLVSFVLGAITGVAMWFTSIQVSPRTIGLMVQSFHWVWATEWTFFSLEVVSGYAFYRYGKFLNDRARLTLLVIYSLAAWFSLFWINGILSWQLTPGSWIETQRAWIGFFNAGFWPSLLYRTVASVAVAALIALVVVNAIPNLERSDREQLVGHVSVLLAPMLLMPFLGLWYLLSMPADSRAWATGGSVAMTMFLTIAVGASSLIGWYSLVAFWYGRLYINGATAGLLTLLAFAATGGGEFVREGVRKPFTVRETLYSNGIHRDEVAEWRRIGMSNAAEEYPLRTNQVHASPIINQGAIVFRQQCSVCHTLGGVNAADELSRGWSDEQMRINIAQLQRTKPFMPPFAGTAEEVEALVQFLRWHQQGKPETWSLPADEIQRETLARIQAYLDQAGTEPSDMAQRNAAMRASAGLFTQKR